MRFFKSKANLKEYLNNLDDVDLQKELKSNNPDGKKVVKKTKPVKKKTKVAKEKK